MELPNLPCQIRSLNLGCFGCCGRLYLEKEKVISRISLNTKALQENQNKKEGKLSLKEFCFRQTALSQSGVCMNVIEEEGMFMCGVHPKLNASAEVREDYCNTKYLCKLAKAWTHWNEERKKQFLVFLFSKKENGMDSYEYSMLNDKEVLIKEFTQFSPI